MNKKENKKENKWIKIKGAKTHNLKNISVSIPRGEMTVITGLSGSGKSSLAFDTIFAEGQRRYIESLSAYARQFLRQMQKPVVDEITGLSPAISIDQKSRSNNPRSTVATITEIYDYLRVLFSRVGQVVCVKCGRDICKHSKEEITASIIESLKKNKYLTENTKIKGIALNKRKIKIYSPLVLGRKGEYYQLLYDMLSKGYETVKVDGKVHSLRNKIALTKTKKHNIDVLVDEFYISEYKKDKKVFVDRLLEAVERALDESLGLVSVEYPDGAVNLISSKFFCPYDGFSFPEVEPRLFSFNSPYGACTECNGLGVLDVFFGDICPVCNGSRLRNEPLHVFISNEKTKQRKNIIDVISMNIKDCLNFFANLSLTDNEKEVAKDLIKEITNRLYFMLDVGLEYLTLDRRANTLSGGEAQRIRLASQLGSGLVGALYVLDEPTIGLHQRDNLKLINTLFKLKSLGNTIIVVEHDEDTIFSSDYIVDIGPGAGVHGGEVVCADFLETLLTKKNNTNNSLTLSYLRGETKIKIPKKRRDTKIGRLKFKDIKINNINGIDAEIPLGKFLSITGVSGSGKSTLLYDVLYKNLRDKIDRHYKTIKNTNVSSFEGYENLGRVVLIDQSPIGRTPRSTPITYVGAFIHIRNLFANLEETRYRGWKAGRFSFNVAGGRCDQCEGNGTIAVEMHFLPTVYITCDLCRGKRYNKEVLGIKYKKKNIYDVLSMSVEDAVKFFKDIPNIYDRIKTLEDVGLGYLTLGQPSTTLSGGEAQRVKISSELYRKNTTKTIYLLDEPTVGLHYEDVYKLIEILNKLVDRQNTVIVIEHNMDIIKSSDYLIDMGPEGGSGGGNIVCSGTPEQVAENKVSHTAKFIKKILKDKKNI